MKIFGNKQGVWLVVKISVIIPVYNCEKYLSKCLDSIVNQTLQDIEIICINKLINILISNIIIWFIWKILSDIFGFITVYDEIEQTKK